MEARPGKDQKCQAIVLSVPAMTCRHCVRSISAHLRDVSGVAAVEADPASRTVRVVGNPHPDALRSAIAMAGYEAVDLQEGEPTMTIDVPADTGLERSR